MVSIIFSMRRGIWARVSFGNANRANNAQISSIYEGKILRFNLEPDADPGAYDKWIPDDNPYNGAKESAVWSTGIRNNQGFAYDSVRGVLYGASHGPFSDDEINIIQAGKNYGHPLVIGYSNDGNYDGAKAGPRFQFAAAYKLGADQCCHYRCFV